MICSSKNSDIQDKPKGKFKVAGRSSDYVIITQQYVESNFVPRACSIEVEKSVKYLAKSTYKLLSVVAIVS
jgi:hypothetical protein